MADAPESPLSKSLREAVESQARQLAAARDAYAARQQAKAAANDGDGDAKMLPPIEELAVEDAADAAAQPKGSSDESSDDDRRVAQRKGDDATPLGSRPATPLERDEMATDWTKHLRASDLYRRVQSKLPADTLGSGELLELLVERETGVPLDGPTFGDPYAGYGNSQARYDAQERVAKAQAALDAAEELRACCDLCAKTLVDEDFNVGDRVKVGDERGVVMRLPLGVWWKVRVGDEDKPRSLRAEDFTSLDGGTTGSCFRVGCERRRCASCQEERPLVAPSLCQGCPQGVFLPYKAQTVFRTGAPELYGPFELSDGLRTELEKASPDVRQVIWHLERELGYMLCPDDVKLSDPLFMKALKDRLLMMDRERRWLGDLDLGVTYWRVCETVEES